MPTDLHNLPRARKRLSYGLRIVIAEAGLNQNTVAERMAVTASYLAQLCRGAKNPSQEVLESLAEALDIKISEIYQKGEAALEREAARHHQAEQERLQREQSLESHLAALPTLGVGELRILQREIDTLIAQRNADQGSS